ncbi:type II toxin-antitoxin system RelE/ParE family toxin [Sinomonas sp. ASV322]|uniref:type II toxin-antitoxin system RelE family toxin n=1 Tax=Sinomonas sp. ASV322 TaxID=3041920 RepID=UPI0027DB1382|nr:type II toxin-antitoxin system RelE/ParE family toxin [Sinomonas sp. ASV322]MDQ4503536.1 type II toxin-antitoxin system RelE/ParE family toxin [Sinomonas sp. ASV322]
MTAAYEPRLAATALRGLASLSPRVAEPLLAFAFGSLAENPRRRGHQLRNELSGYWSARRGDFRVIYRLDDEAMVMLIIDIGPRNSIYRTR